MQSPLKQFQRAIEVAKSLVDQDPAELSFRQVLGLGLQRRASLLLTMGRFDQAARDFQQSEEIFTVLYQENPNNLMVLRDLADCRQVRGDLARTGPNGRTPSLHIKRALSCGTAEQMSGNHPFMTSESASLRPA